jgi:hypothetical protein
MVPGMKKTFALLFVVAFAPALVLAQRASGVVTTIEGRVTVTRLAQPSPVVLRFKDEIFPGDRIITAGQGLVKILLGGRALLAVRERSALTIASRVSKPTLELDSGNVTYSVHCVELGEPSEIRTPNAVVAVCGSWATDTLIIDVQARSTHMEGEMTPAVTRIDNWTTPSAADRLAGSVSVRFIGGLPVRLPPRQGVTVTGNRFSPFRKLPVSPPVPTRDLGDLGAATPD